MSTPTKPHETSHNHAHGHGGGHAHGHSHGGDAAAHANDAELAQTLNLDARILGSYLNEATAWAAELAGRSPQRVIDVGAGSGVGTLALARQFPAAVVTALDKSADMLALTLAAAAENGLEGRVRTLQADLDEAWPASAAADLLWASSSLHEVAAPERILAGMYTALNSGGLLVVLEMDVLPSFLPQTMPEGSAVPSGLESRLHEILAAKGWNHFPEWTPLLESAGFAVERRPFPSSYIPAGHAPTSGESRQVLAARYARHFIQRIHQALADTAEAADAAALELLLGDGPESLERRADLEVRGHRTGWAARKA